MGRASGLGPRLFVFSMTGIIISGIITVMFLTKSINLDNFYNVGALYDIADTNYMIQGDNWNYDYESGLIVAHAKNASCVYSVNHSRKNWGYLYLDIRNLSEDTPAKMDFLGADSELLYTIDFELQNGGNILQLQESNVYYFRFSVQNPVSFAINGIQFQERAQDFAWNQAPAVFAVALVCCFPIMFLTLFLIYRRAGRRARSKRNPWIEVFQRCYARILERCSALLYGFSEREKSLLRRIFFLISFLILYFSYRRGWKGDILSQRRMILALGICFLCIAILSWEGSNRLANWRNPLVYAWFAISFLCIVSDFVVVKHIRNIGIFMLCAMGPFYMAQSNMKKPERLIRDLLASLRWFYWAVCLVCLIFRPFTPGIRYNGIYDNPNLFAGFLAGVHIAFLTCLDENLGKERVKKRVLLENILGLVTIWGFLQLTESLTSLLTWLMEWVVFLWKQFPNEKNRIYYQNLRRVLLLSLISIGLVSTLGKWGISNVSNVIDTYLVLEDEQQLPASGISSPLSLKVEAAGDTGLSDRIIQKITSGEWYSLFTGRTLVWKTYIRNWNLFGHTGNLESLDGVWAHAHNAVLQMINNYGIFMMIPYLILLYYSIKYAIIAVLHENRTQLNLVFVLSSVSYVVLGLAEDMATPYSYMNWLIFYITLGGMFHQQSGKTET